VECRPGTGTSATRRLRELGRVVGRRALKSPAPYARIGDKLARGGTVILDGGIGSELERVGFERARNTGALWGTRALYEAPELVRNVHRAYVDAGADVITTNTWQLGSMPAAEAAGLVDGSRADWREQARLAIAYARAEANEAESPPAVAFSLSVRCLGEAFLEELLNAISDDPPDLFLPETLTSVPPETDVSPFELLVATGVPVWLAYRRCREGICDVHGEIIDRDSESFARAIPVLEELGIETLLINCLPPDLLDGTLEWMRTLTDLPLGVYPNIGRYLSPGWDFEGELSPEDYGRNAVRWRDEQGAQIIGGCCGVTPAHIAATVEALSRR
jgi:S-methylmethionine-dependent homocysteine/selenocysteine methylase